MAFNYPRRVTIGELYRDMQSNEVRLQSSLKAIDDRISGVSQNMMRADVAQLIHDDMNRRIANLQADSDTASEHAWSTRSTLLLGLLTAGMSSALTVLITLLVQH